MVLVDADSRHLVVVNLCERPAQARVRLPWSDIADATWQLEDRLSGMRFGRAGDELAADGLYVALDGWAYHFLAFSPAPVTVGMEANPETVAA